MISNDHCLKFQDTFPFYTSVLITLSAVRIFSAGGFIIRNIVIFICWNDLIFSKLRGI